MPGNSRKRVSCSTCGSDGVYTAVGPNRVPAYVCKTGGCDSYVGVHKGTENALGTLAGPELRTKRLAAHRWIDRLWRGKAKPTRREVYRIIGRVLGIRHFHVAQCDMSQMEMLEARRGEIEDMASNAGPAVMTTLPCETLLDPRIG